MKRRVIQAAAQSWQTHLQWLTPGIGVKRWLIVLALGVGLLSLGGSVALRASCPLPQHLYYLTLQFLLPSLWAGGILTLLARDSRLRDLRPEPGNPRVFHNG
jgi:hypothetical protein